MEVGHGMFRKRSTVEDTESRSSRRKRKLDDPNFNNQLEVNRSRSIVNYPHSSVDVCSETTSSSSSELKHGELRSKELKNDSDSNQAETENSSTEISKPKPLIGDNFSEKSITSSSDSKRMKQTMTKKSPSAKMPPMEEIESFFSANEKYEQKKFSEKYNFDIVKDIPMEEGRYEWIQINP